VTRQSDQFGTTFTLQPSVEGLRRKSHAEKLEEIEEHERQVEAKRGHLGALARERAGLTLKIDALERAGDLTYLAPAPSSVAQWLPGATKMVVGGKVSDLAEPARRALNEVNELIAQAEEELQQLEPPSAA
jgi:hypothetical protein